MQPSLVRVMIASLSLVWAVSAFGKAKNFNRPHVPGELIIQFDQTVTPSQATAIIQEAGGKPIHGFRSSPAMLVRFAGAKSAVDLFQIAHRLTKTKGVKVVEANQILYANATLPNDARFDELYGLHNDGATGGSSGADIDAPEAWDTTKGSRDVLVGVIDTGIDYNHPDLAANMWTNPGETGQDADGNDKRTNGIDDDGNGYIDDFRGWDFANNDNDPMDDNKHGTHCAGTIGAVGNDGQGVVGVNWEVSMVGIKFLTGGGSGSLANAVLSIEYATNLGVTLTSNSWGGGGFSDTMAAAIQQAEDAGILFVAAAGNSASDNDRNPHFPSSYEHDNVLAVAATDHNDGRASFSCYGLISVDVGAPGADILSTVPSGGYSKLSGTSMATPHVAGIAALVKSHYPNATYLQIKDRIMNTADPVPDLAGKTVTGGRANAFNSLENDSIPPGAVTGLGVLTAGQTSVDVQWNAAGDDGDTGLAKRYEVRIASAPINNAADWDAATPVRALMQGVNGTNQINAQITDLPFNTEGHFAVRAADNVGNRGPVSASQSFAVTKVTVVASNPAETMDDVVADAPWGLQAADPHPGNAFSDSPAGEYANDANISLTLPAFIVSAADPTLVIKTKYNIEPGYDFGYVEISTDGGTTWTELDKITGTSDWVMLSYPLGATLAGKTQLQLRLRLTSDFSITRDGWLIDDIQIFAPAN